MFYMIDDSIMVKWYNIATTNITVFSAWKRVNNYLQAGKNHQSTNFCQENNQLFGQIGTDPNHNLFNHLEHGSKARIDAVHDAYRQRRDLARELIYNQFPGLRNCPEINPDNDQHIEISGSPFDWRPKDSRIEQLESERLEIGKNEGQEKNRDAATVRLIQEYARTYGTAYIGRFKNDDSQCKDDFYRYIWQYNPNETRHLTAEFILPGFDHTLDKLLKKNETQKNWGIQPAIEQIHKSQGTLISW